MTARRRLLAVLVFLSSAIAPALVVSTHGAAAAPATRSSVSASDTETVRSAVAGARPARAGIPRCSKIWLGSVLTPQTGWSSAQQRRYAHGRYRIYGDNLSGCFFTVCLQIYINGEWTGFAHGTERGYCANSQVDTEEYLAVSYGWAVPPCSDLRYERIRSLVRATSGSTWVSGPVKDLCD